VTIIKFKHALGLIFA